MEIEKKSEKNNETELSFKPLTDGLGFHPFSEGLPYASNAGTGAVSAGAPSFVHPDKAPKTAFLPPRPAPISQAQATAPTPSVKVSIPAPSMTPPAFVKKATPTHPLAAPVSIPVQLDTSPPLAIEPSYGFGYVAKRVAAYLFDSLLHLALFVGGITAATAAFGGTLVQGTDWMILIGLCFVFVHLFLTTTEEWMFKNTPGKRLLGLRLEGPRSAILIRAIAFPVSLAIFGLGVFWALFDVKRRCWHDLASNVQPIEI